MNAVSSVSSRPIPTRTADEETAPAALAAQRFPAQRLSREGPPASLDAPDLSADDSAEANGWLGNDSLQLSLSQSPSGETATGSLGMANIDLSEQIDGSGDGSIDGTLQGMNGEADVHVDAHTQKDGSRTYFGDVGNAGISLTDEPQKDGSHWIVGDFGGRQISFTETSNGGKLQFNGDNLSTITVDPHGKPVSAEILIPLLGL
ncbi:MAG: hypothetical protein ACYCW6_13520 [Candidatus Xenobia bacterium]